MFVRIVSGGHYYSTRFPLNIVIDQFHSNSGYLKRMNIMLACQILRLVFQSSILRFFFTCIYDFEGHPLHTLFDWSGVLYIGLPFLNSNTVRFSILFACN